MMKSRVEPAAIPTVINWSTQHEHGHWLSFLPEIMSTLNLGNMSWIHYLKVFEKSALNAPHLSQVPCCLLQGEASVPDVRVHKLLFRSECAHKHWARRQNGVKWFALTNLIAHRTGRHTSEIKLLGIGRDLGLKGSLIPLSPLSSLVHIFLHHLVLSPWVLSSNQSQKKVSITPSISTVTKSRRLIRVKDTAPLGKAAFSAHFLPVHPRVPESHHQFVLFWKEK